MPYVTEIRKFAAEIGRHAEQRAVYLKHELADITARKAEIETHLRSTTVLQDALRGSSLRTAEAFNAHVVGLTAKRDLRSPELPTPDWKTASGVLNAVSTL